MDDDKYGLNFDHPVDGIELELYCFREGRTPEQGGLGRYEHFCKAANLIWPNLDWNPWLDSQIESLCEYDWVSWTGCAASGKTFSSTLYALVWWLSDPFHSTVLFTSTTAKMIRKRAWANLQHLYHTADGRLPGNMVDSKTCLQATKGDDKNAIFAIAVLDGATSKSVANIQGVHSERILCIVDEATDTPEAAFEATSNLNKGCREFQFLAIGNPHSVLDEHGRFSEPADGWNSVSIETQSWETQRGVCVRFDGAHSPNIKAGETKWPYLITANQVRQAVEFEGESSPRFWKFTRGWWAPQGVVRTVLSEAMCQKHEVQLGHIFQTGYEMLAGLDPAFGGDRCILRFAKYGDLENDRMAVEFTEVIHIDIDAGSNEPVHYQIARRVKQECIARNVRANMFAIDSTGEGGGLADILMREWSPLINRVEFGGKASEMPVSLEDGRCSHEVYANRVTELWFSMREWVQHSQVGGLDRDTIIEFCQRLFDDEKRKIVVERKVDMKGRIGCSPDLADAAVLIIEMARRLGAGELTSAISKDSDWDEVAQEYNNLYTEDNLYAEME